MFTTAKSISENLKEKKRISQPAPHAPPSPPSPAKFIVNFPPTQLYHESFIMTWVQAITHRDCKAVVSCLSLQRLWPPPVSLPCCATGRSIIKRAMVQMQKICSGTCKLNAFYSMKNVYQPSPPPLTNLLSIPPILAYLQCFHLL